MQASVPTQVQSRYMQAFGLSQPKFILGGTLTGAAADYWDVLWPHATNTVSVGFLLLSRSPEQLQPTQVIIVMRPLLLKACSNTAARLWP